MALNSNQIGRLLEMIRRTKEVEMSCPECLDELDKYTQRTLDGAPLDEALHRVREHLEVCRCCTDQFKLVLETLEVIEES